MALGDGLFIVDTYSQCQLCRVTLIAVVESVLLESNKRGSIEFIILYLICIVRLTISMI